MTRPGTRNIPEPITVPMIRRTRSGKRSTRRSFVALAAKASELDAVGEGVIDISSPVKIAQTHMCRHN